MRVVSNSGEPEYPGAKRPDRRRMVDAAGARISVVEWGAESDPPLLLAHGGFDFAETMNVFAPMLVAGGWRVVSWDHRGHGDSEWASDGRYGPDAMVEDLRCILTNGVGERLKGITIITRILRPGSRPRR